MDRILIILACLIISAHSWSDRCTIRVMNLATMHFVHAVSSEFRKVQETKIRYMETSESDESIRIVKVIAPVDRETEHTVEWATVQIKVKMQDMGSGEEVDAEEIDCDINEGPKKIDRGFEVISKEAWEHFHFGDFIG